ncbi:unnamed protein product [Paramecium pentaurelia]|uniref:Uncharacterized protein n=1 Tax=Paramecium pentaurelia TaxID=43138 RepID=A0A8S1X9A5_9CILI|nr:unnamed protein product [Paramecium pentaurelia]
MIELTLKDFNGDDDPFKKENNIITPLLVTFKNCLRKSNSFVFKQCKTIQN